MDLHPPELIGGQHGYQPAFGDFPAAHGSEQRTYSSFRQHGLHKRPPMIDAPCGADRRFHRPAIGTDQMQPLVRRETGNPDERVRCKLCRLTRRPMPLDIAGSGEHEPPHCS